jgi:hypothetical protein
MKRTLIDREIQIVRGGGKPSGERKGERDRETVARDREARGTTLKHCAEA